MSGWGTSKGIEGNYEDEQEEASGPADGAASPHTSEPVGDDRARDEESLGSSARQVGETSCKAATRAGTPCTNDAIEAGYCGHHAPNAAGELTWQFQRHQMYMQEGEETALSRLRKRIELDHELELTKKEFQRSMFQVMLENDTVREELTKLLIEKYDSE